MNDLLLELRVRNLPLYKAIFTKYKSVSEFCAEAGLDESDLGRLLNLKKSPRNRKTDEWSKPVVKCARFFRMLEEDLFPESAYRVKNPKRLSEVNSKKLALFLDGERGRLEQRCLPPDVVLEYSERHEAIERSLGMLTPRERAVLNERFDREATLKESARTFQVSRECIRQIEAKALRKLRHPRRARPIKESSTWNT